MSASVSVFRVPLPSPRFALFTPEGVVGGVGVGESLGDAAPLHEELPAYQYLVTHREDKTSEVPGLFF